MAVFKVTIFCHVEGDDGQAIYYVEKDTPKAAYEHGVTQSTNIFGAEATRMHIYVEQDHP